MNAPSPSPAKNKKLKAYKRGKWAEYLAAVWLLLKGYRILALRYKTPHGEIDLIAKRGKIIAFIEVKARSDYESAKLSVSRQQRKRISDAATLYIKRKPKLSILKARYDIIAITPNKLPKHVIGAW